MKRWSVIVILLAAAAALVLQRLQINSLRQPVARLKESAQTPAESPLSLPNRAPGPRSLPDEQVREIMKLRNEVLKLRREIEALQLGTNSAAAPQQPEQLDQ